MTAVEEQIKCLSEHVAELYFVERDYETLSHFIDDNICWIGTGKNEVCLGKEESIKFFQKEVAIYDGNFDIVGQWFHCLQITEDSCLVMAVINIKINSENATLTSDVLRFSAIWKAQGSNKEWKLVHVHNSVPDAHIGEETYLNMSIAESNFEKFAKEMYNAQYIDKLTNINNEQGFEYEVDQLLNSNKKKKYALIKFELRNLRFINFKFGYEIGDQLLIEIGKNLKKSLKKNETCGRIEKGRFAMLYQYDNKEKFERRMDRVRKQLVGKRMSKKVKDIDIQLSAGIYLINDNCKEYVKYITDKALIAMQNVNTSLRGNHYTYFEDTMLLKQYQDIRVVEEAPKAIEDDDFQLFIQPQFDINTKEIISGEALTRWKLKDGTLRMPDEFIENFEKDGMIISFDFYMLEKLCKQLREWLNQGYQIVPISINQSRLHIKNENYLEKFCHIVDLYEIPHKYIIFELTETAFMEDNEEMRKIVEELHKKDFQIAIDDFGSGYASLNLLSYISADILKIDRTLLKAYDTNQRVRIVMENILEMAHQMNMIVIAEGIETEKQLLFLQELGCDVGQGYYVGRGMEAKLFFKQYLKGELKV